MPKQSTPNPKVVPAPFRKLNSQFLQYDMYDSAERDSCLCLSYSEKYEKDFSILSIYLQNRVVGL